jgi:hypothetical protein
MSYWVSGATVASAVIGGVASNAAAGAGEEAAAAGMAQNRIANRQQNALSAQQLELQRPLINTRDAALNQLNAFFGLPQTTPSRTSFGSGAEGVVALPGITTRQDGQVSGGRDIRQTVYFDPGVGAIVDETGSIIANVPEGGGVLAGLTSGRNNQVGIGADGTLYQIGSDGQQVPIQGINQRLTRAPQAAQASATGARTTGTGPDFSNILNLPIFDFQRREGESVINRNLANRGKFFSGERGAGLLRFNNALVANRINEDFVQPRLTLAGYGQNAGNAAQNALGGQAANVGQAGVNQAMLASDRGNARASGYAGTANAITGAVGNLLTLRELERRPRYTGPYENRTAGTPTMNVPPYRTPPFNPNIPRTYGGYG